MPKHHHGGPGELDSSIPLGLSLSGGGHRAALFGLGVLMAMRDAGREPEQISSVSGGSITNAFLAYKYFAKVSADQGANDALWQRETQELFETIVNKGAVTKVWIRLLVAFLIIPPFLFVLAAIFSMLPPWRITIPLGIAWATALLLRGMLIEWLISLRYFDGLFKKVKLADIGKSSKEHVICCTDLIAGRALYISTRGGGQIFRMFTDKPLGMGPKTYQPFEDDLATRELGVLYDASNFSVAAAVRASAGFPGIPPRRIQLKQFERAADDSGKFQGISSLAFLSDGGILNNLATQAYEDGFLWGLEHGTWTVMVADASAPLDYAKSMSYHIPVRAERLALLRQANIQNFNTVRPRKVMFHDWMRMTLSWQRIARIQAEHLYPVVSIIEHPEDVKRRLAAAINCGSPFDFFLNEVEQKWGEEHRMKSQKRVRNLEENNAQQQSLIEESTVDSHAVRNFRRLCGISVVGSSRGDTNAPDPVSSCPTTLDKIERATALAVVGRGYANAAITLYLTGLADKLVFPKGWLGREK